MRENMSSDFRKKEGSGSRESGYVVLPISTSQRLVTRNRPFRGSGRRALPVEGSLYS